MMIVTIIIVYLEVYFYKMSPFTFNKHLFIYYYLFCFLYLISLSYISIEYFSLFIYNNIIIVYKEFIHVSYPYPAY